MLAKHHVASVRDVRCTKRVLVPPAVRRSSMSGLPGPVVAVIGALHRHVLVGNGCSSSSSGSGGCSRGGGGRGSGYLAGTRPLGALRVLLALGTGLALALAGLVPLLLGLDRQYPPVDVRLGAHPAGHLDPRVKLEHRCPVRRRLRHLRRRRPRRRCCCCLLSLVQRPFRTHRTHRTHAEARTTHTSARSGPLLRVPLATRYCYCYRCCRWLALAHRYIAAALASIATRLGSAQLASSRLVSPLPQLYARGPRRSEQIGGLPFSLALARA